MSLAERTSDGVMKVGSHSWVRVAVLLRMSSPCCSPTVSRQLLLQPRLTRAHGTNRKTHRQPRPPAGWSERKHGFRVAPSRRGAGCGWADVTATTDSTNWSGLGGEGNGIEGAAGEWTVPAIEPSTSGLYSTSWVGVDGLNNSDLIQTGTEQDTSDGYYAWIEILPASEEELFNSDGSPAPVEPGDQIDARMSSKRPLRTCGRST